MSNSPDAKHLLIIFNPTDISSRSLNCQVYEKSADQWLAVPWTLEASEAERIAVESIVRPSQISSDALHTSERMLRYFYQLI